MVDVGAYHGWEGSDIFIVKDGITGHMIHGHTFTSLGNEEEVDVVYYGKPYDDYVVDRRLDVGEWYGPSDRPIGALVRYKKHEDAGLDALIGIEKIIFSDGIYDIIEGEFIPGDYPEPPDAGEDFGSPPEGDRRDDSDGGTNEPTASPDNGGGNEPAEDPDGGGEDIDSDGGGGTRETLPRDENADGDTVEDGSAPPEAVPSDADEDNTPADLPPPGIPSSPPQGQDTGDKPGEGCEEDCAPDSDENTGSSGNVFYLRTGTSGNDDMVGGAGNEFIFGMGGDDTIAGNGGDDLITGGNRFPSEENGERDTAVFNWNRDEYTVSRGERPKTLIVDHVGSSGHSDGRDTLTDIEFLQFRDGLWSVGQSDDDDVITWVTDAPSASDTPLTDLTATAGRPLAPVNVHDAFVDPDGEEATLALSYAVEGLPDGLHFNALTKEIGGVPKDAGSAVVSVIATDEHGAEFTQTFNLTVEPAGPVVSADGPPTGSDLDDHIAETGNQNILNGGDGDDTISGYGPGNIMTGGGGADDFQVHKVPGEDWSGSITDFVVDEDDIEFFGVASDEVTVEVTAGDTVFTAPGMELTVVGQTGLREGADGDYVFSTLS